MKIKSILYIAFFFSVFTQLHLPAYSKTIKGKDVSVAKKTEAPAPAETGSELIEVAKIDVKEEPNEQTAAQVDADTLEYHEKESKVIAKGNVIVTYGNRVLRASEVTYNQETNIITATGNVHLDDGNGNSYYGEIAELNDKLTKGTVSDLRGTLSDKSRFAANSAIRESSDVTILQQAAYSPCKICKKRNKGKPLWQISSNSVKLDKSKERVFYEHATLDIFGVPLLYTPYLSHPTPGAGRKDGFLVPSYRSINTLGVAVKTPYYYNVAPNMDFTFEPIFTTEEGAILSGEFRHLTKNGNYQLSGSITNPRDRNEFGVRTSGREIRGHIEGSGRFDLGNDWSWGFEGKRSTDDTYLQRYKFGNEDLLTSTAYVENISGRNYLGAKVISFQGLNVFDDPDTTPLVLPLVSAHYETEPGYMGSRFIFDGDAMALTRSLGQESRRLSGKASWVLPHVTKSGHVFEFRASLRGDVYSVNNVMTTTTGLFKDGFIGRVIPQAQLKWSYPLVGGSDETRIFLEPIVDLIVSPHGGNPNKIPNEDSLELEISDVNLFSDNHFTGLDRVEGGPRTNYGFRGRVLNDSIGSLNFLLGQSYRAREDESFTPESGLDDNFSDYVGRIGISDNEHAEIFYRFRSDKDTYTMRHNEVGTALRADPINLSVSYISLDEEGLTIVDREEISGAASLRINDNWSINGGGRRDLTSDGGWISSYAGFTYEDECIRIISQFDREFTRDRDIEPSSSIKLKIEFKNLGSVL